MFKFFINKDHIVEDNKLLSNTASLLIHAAKIDDNYTVEGELRSQVGRNIKRLIDVGTYRGSRHKHGLPVNGQNTKNNARTRKGKKRTVANKKKAV